MKRILGIGFGVVALGVIGSYIGGQLMAQYPPAAMPGGPAPAQPAAAPLRTRVATVNLIQIIKNYRKCQACEAQIKSQIEIVDKAMEEKKKLLVAFKTEAENPQTAQPRREQLEKEFKRVQREMQEMDEDFKNKFNRQRGEMAVQLYREIEDAVQSYARSHEIELVLHYNDATVPADMYNPMNVQRKMQGSCMPMYIAPGMDITAQIADMLNNRYGAAPAAH